MNSLGWVGAIIFVYGTAVISGVDAIASKFTGPVVEGHGTIKASVKPGETVMAHWEIAKRTDCAGMASRVWRGTGNYLLVEAARPTTIPMSDNFVRYNIPTQIPETAPPGVITVEIKGEYSCSGAKRSFTLGPLETSVVYGLD